MNYCPLCWPADLGEYENGRCLDCGSRILAATPEKQIELLLEQNEALAAALGEAQDLLNRALGSKNDSPKPALRLVHSASKKNDKESRS